jgi:cytosine/creatinine deaminase
MDLVLKNVRLNDGEPLVNVAVEGGKIAAIGANVPTEATEVIDGEGRVLIPGLVEGHIHLDKALIAERAVNRSGTLVEALRVTAELKPTFTKEDIYDRATRALKMCLSNGSTRMRAHAEFDPAGGMGGFETTMRLKREYAHAIDIQVVAFPQEGIIKAPGTEKMMYEAMEMGADVVGGVPYNDSDAHKHIDIVFEIAKKYGKPVDLHQDFKDDADGITIEYVCRKAIEEGFIGRVAVGHLTAIGALPPARLQEVMKLMKEADITVFSLPATDLHLGGRKDEYNVRRTLTPVRALRDAGINVCFASNNIRNPFTPFGLGDVLQIAMLGVHTAHLGGADDLPTVLPMVTTNAARGLGLTDYGLEVGKTADMVLLDTARVADAVIDQPARLAVVKSGRVTVRKQISVEMNI